MARPGNGKKAVFPPLHMGILTDIGQSVQRRGNGRKGENWCPLWRRPNYRDGQG
jgi:hypothetical protein